MPLGGSHTNPGKPLTSSPLHPLPPFPQLNISVSRELSRSVVHCCCWPRASVMAAISTDLATAFFGLARRQAAVGFRARGILLSPLPRHFRVATAPRAFSARAAVAVRAVLPSPRPRRGPRRFGSSTTASSSSSYAAAADEEEIDGILTKIPPDVRIPATIITGFLGSGKTTLLNHILTADHGKRIAVIENEYGEVDIDGSLVAAKTTGAEDIIMLNNGCLCCTVRGDLVRMIAELVDKKKGKFDHIVIETTGLANPAPIIQTFYAEDKVFNDVKLDGVVTLVDAKHAHLHLDEVKPKGIVNEAVEQVAYADRIIVNKNINGMAHMKRTQYGKVELDYVLGIGGFDLERIESVVNAEGSEDHHTHEEHHHDHDHDHDHEHCHHHDHHDHKHGDTDVWQECNHLI
ncbi:hypothetical protein Taro_049441 [Colocasia esculenta]|uniref:CobW/HypB/UreG nucleotide-binding domain-containing protein n=1 Tax=Colocasia esculenta TaxID=4460 RepID=A0A843XAS3_COLES|nr:hypothetical protein [Colocasia esculenta]